MVQPKRELKLELTDKEIDAIVYALDYIVDKDDPDSAISARVQNKVLRVAKKVGWKWPMDRKRK